MLPVTSLMTQSLTGMGIVRACIEAGETSYT